ncbi:glycosyltransferase family 31 protein [Apodospora peruviana]|uniref:Glycosyltransferase family 31 protein n=1 Tax=Apodospora peruviana TaxID=516989 RepID=A0AAE0IBG9_9PEZI|nr:glycosyltransferase family 31 protein [Apodospora peruviana]
MRIKVLSQRSRSLRLVVFVTLCIILLTASRLNGPSVPKAIFRVGKHHSHDAARNRPKLPPGQCSPDIEFLRRLELQLTENIVYTRRCIKPIRGKFDRDVLTNISHPLVRPDNRTTVNLTSCAHAALPPCEPLSLKVPMPYPQRQYKHLLFGVATNYERMQNSLESFAHWLAGTGAQLYGTIIDANQNKKLNLSALEELYRQEGIVATFRPPPVTAQPIPVEHHHFMLIRELLNISSDETKWLGIVDDDTFFPSLYDMDEELKRYDSRKPVWLGALSDDFDSVKLWGFMAFGGAGTFLSAPLARQIEPHAESCLSSAPAQTGDGILKHCIYTHTRTKLTVVDGLHQHDLRGDVSGLFESGVRPLSIHHWKSWYREPIPKMASVTAVCGDCFLQRWQFGNDTLFANGYSITFYPEGNGLRDIDLSRIEGTFRPQGNEYDFSYGPLRPALQPETQKKSYKLVDVDVTHFRQIYVHRKSDAWQADEGAMDEVIELVWEV